MLEFLVDNIVVVFCFCFFFFFFWKCLPADSRHCNGYDLRPSSIRHISVLMQSGIHSMFSQWARNSKLLVSRFNITPGAYTSMMYCLLTFQTFVNYLGHMCPVEIEIKDMTESNTPASCLDLLLSITRYGQIHTSIYDKRDDIDHTSQTFRFWVAVFHFRRPLAFSTHSICDMLNICDGCGKLARTAYSCGNFVSSLFKLIFDTFFQNLSFLSRLFRFEYPSVLPWFCF